MLSDKLVDMISDVRSGSDSAFENLAEQYSPLIFSVCSKYEKIISENETYGSSADLRQELTYALYRAAVTYNTEQDAVTFGRYAKRCLENRAVSFLRKIGSRKRREAKAAERIRHERPFETFLPGVSGDRRDEVIESFSDCLSPYECLVFTKYIDGASAGEIASELGKDEKSVNNAVFRSKAKIRKLYKKSL